MKTTHKKQVMAYLVKKKKKNGVNTWSQYTQLYIYIGVHVFRLMWHCELKPVTYKIPPMTSWKSRKRKTPFLCVHVTQYNNVVSNKYTGILLRSFTHTWTLTILHMPPQSMELVSWHFDRDSSTHEVQQVFHKHLAVE